MVTVKETEDAYRIKCKPCNSSHYIPKVGRPGKTWTFVNKDFVRPTFVPSMNESHSYKHETTGEDVLIRRCHYVLTDGVMNYCPDCTHNMAGQSLALEPFTEAELNEPW